jgi:hypothetical protein
VTSSMGTMARATQRYTCRLPARSAQRPMRPPNRVAQPPAR